MHVSQTSQLLSLWCTQFVWTHRSEKHNEVIRVLIKPFRTPPRKNKNKNKNKQKNTKKTQKKVIDYTLPCVCSGVGHTKIVSFACHATWVGRGAHPKERPWRKFRSNLKSKILWEPKTERGTKSFRFNYIFCSLPYDRRRYRKWSIFSSCMVKFLIISSFSHSHFSH